MSTRGPQWTLTRTGPNSSLVERARLATRGLRCRDCGTELDHRIDGLPLHIPGCPREPEPIGHRADPAPASQLGVDDLVAIYEAGVAARTRFAPIAVALRVVANANQRGRHRWRRCASTGEEEP